MSDATKSNDSQAEPVCPEFIVAIVNKRFNLETKWSAVDERIALLRWMFPIEKVRRSQFTEATIVQRSECDLETQTCSGEEIACWAIWRGHAPLFFAEPTAQELEEAENFIQQIEILPVVEFAVSDDGKTAVVRQGLPKDGWHTQLVDIEAVDPVELVEPREREKPSSWEAVVGYSQLVFGVMLMIAGEELGGLMSGGFIGEHEIYFVEHIHQWIIPFRRAGLVLNLLIVVALPLLCVWPRKVEELEADVLEQHVKEYHRLNMTRGIWITLIFTPWVIGLLLGLWNQKTYFH